MPSISFFQVMPLSIYFCEVSSSSFSIYILIYLLYFKFWVHVLIVQVCYIGIHVPWWWFAASIASSSILGMSPNAIPPQSPTLCCYSSLSPSLSRPWWCSPPYIHVFSLFNTHLWVRTCDVWFSVLVSVCWEWWFPDSSMSLQRTQTHHFLWLHSIPWCICATFSLFSLSSMGIWVGFRSSCCVDLFIVM